MRSFSLSLTVLSLLSGSIAVAQDAPTQERPEGSIFDAAQQATPYRSAERLPDEPLFENRETFDRGPAEYTPVTPEPAADPFPLTPATPEPDSGPFPVAPATPEPAADPFPVTPATPSYTPDPSERSMMTQPPITSQQRRIIAREAARAKQRRAIIEARKRRGYSALRPNYSYPTKKNVYPDWYYWNTKR